VDRNLVYFQLYHMNPAHQLLVKFSKKSALANLRLFENPFNYDLEKDRNS